MIGARIVVGLQLVSLVATAAASLADRGLLGEFRATSPLFEAIIVGFLFSAFLAPVIVIALPWRHQARDRRLGGVLILETMIILALLYAAIPMVQ